MQELEILLNSLIKRGLSVWNQQVDFCEYKFWKFRFLKKSGQIVCMYSLRELVSLESGLWQFVCDNELTRWYNWDEWKYTETFPWDYRDYPADEYQYRLLESALIPEEGLGKFLVDNIIVKWNSR